MQLRWNILLLDKIYRVASGLHNRLLPRNLDQRVSSYPYLCSDTYLDKSQIKITKKSELENFLQNVSNTSEFGSFYITGELVLDLINTLPQLENFRVQRIVIMESDTQQSTTELEQLLKISKNIYSNNLIGNHKNIMPIPLGLEKQSYRSAGKISNFRAPSVIDPAKRTIDFLVAWNDGTNSSRIKYRQEFMRAHKGLVLNSRVHSKTIHKLMRNTLFVPSPAGNGLDCHRTWEALYLGSVPVVLRKDFCGDDSWPVLIVDSWDDVLKLSRNELEELYLKMALTQNQALEFSEMILQKVFNDNI
jgi:hypothetical protein